MDFHGSSEREFLIKNTQETLVSEGVISFESDLTGDEKILKRLSCEMMGKERDGPFLLLR